MSTIIAIDVEASRANLGPDFFGILDVTGTDGHHDTLSRRDPEGPLAAPVLREHSHHPFYASKHGSMYNNRSFFLRRFVTAPILQIESNRQLKVELNRSTLVHAIQRIRDLDVDLRSIERAVARVHAPPALAREVVHG